MKKQLKLRSLSIGTFCHNFVHVADLEIDDIGASCLANNALKYGHVGEMQNFEKKQINRKT